MSIKISLAATACALALTACGDRTPPAAQETATPAATPTEPAATTPAEPATDMSTPPDAGTTVPDATAPAATTPAAAAPAADTGKPAAVVSNCATTIEGNDAMQFNVGSIAVPASCGKFTITLKHAGKLPVTAMGHNVVITKAADMQAVAADGMAAGADAAYVKAGDARVVAHTSLVGGGQSTSVSFDTSKIKTGGPYEFFCSFPGHSAIMKGTISVG